MKQAYLAYDTELIKMVFSFMSSPTLGNDLIEKKLYPCLAINLLMIAITDSQYEHEKKENLLRFNFKGKYNNYCGITHYINDQGLLRNKDLLKRSYLSMVKLVEVWKERSNRLSTFDYSPEIFLILVSTFIYDPRDYPEILKWTIVNGLPRCDRFYEFIEDIKTSVKAFPAIDPSNSIRKSIISITQAFESIRCRLKNEKNELIINLDGLRSETYSLLSNA